VAVTLVIVATIVAVTVALRSPAIARSGTGTGTGKSPSSCILTVTKVARLGQVTICVDYGYSDHGKIVRVGSVEASFRSRPGFALPWFTFALLSSSGKIDDRFSSAMRQGNAVRSSSSGRLKPRGHFTANEILTVSLHAMNATTDTSYLVIGVALELSRPSFACPAAGSTYDGIPVC
jgi:hypothetical protein